MSAQLSFAASQISSNPNALKIATLVLFVSLTVIGLVVPSAAAFAIPMGGPVDVV
jgi:hypothetical protein